MEREKERRLIREYQRGSREAGEQLLAAHNAKMWQIVRHTNSRGETADDLHQYACQCFLESLLKYSMRDKKRVGVSTWTYRIVEIRVRGLAWRSGLIHLPPNANKTDKEATSRAMQHFCGDIKHDTKELAREHAFDNLDDKDEHEWFQRALVRLPIKQREVLGWILSGHTLEEVGQVLGITKGRVRQIKTNAINNLIAQKSRCSLTPTG